MTNDDQNLNDASNGDDLVHQAIKDEAGQEALEQEELQGDDAPIADEAATGEIGPEVNPDEGAAQNMVGVAAVDETPALTVEETAAAAIEEEIDSLLDASDDNPNARWYVVHTYSGHENKVATTLMQKVASEHLEAFILDVLVPTQDKIEIRSGKKETVKEKIFPGYILVKMVLDDNSWLAVRTTPGVTSFVGIGNKPTPVPESEVRTIVKFMTQGAAPTFKDVYTVNDTVKIIEGPFAQFIGKVDTVDKDRGKVKVLVSIFGRETPVELDFLQVQKL